MMKHLLPICLCGIAATTRLWGQATLTWDSSTSTTGAQDGAGTWNTSNTNWWTGTANTSFVSGDNVTFGAGSGAAGSISVVAGGVTSGNLVFNAAGSSSYTFTGGGITGGALTKNGTNGLRFDNANSFTSVLINNGPNTQSDGAIRLGNANALGTAPITFANTGSMTGLYFLNGFGLNTTMSNNIAFSSTAGSNLTRLLLTGNIGQTVTLSGKLSGGVNTASIRIDNTVASGQAVTRLTNASSDVVASFWEVWRGGLEVTSDGALGNVNNALRLNVGAAGDPVGTGFRFGADNITLNASRAVTIADRTNVNTQNFVGSQIDGAITFTNTLVKKGSTILTLNGSASGVGAIRIDEGTVRIGTGGTTGAVGTGGVAFNAAGTKLVVNRSNAISVEGNITGAGSLEKNGAGQLTLSGTGSNYSGGTTINAGGITIGAAANIGSGDIAFTGVGTNLTLTGTAITLANNISLPTSGSGNVTLLTPNNSSTVINGNIGGGGANTVLFFQGGASGQNTGALTLNGNNTLQGTINVQRGPLILGNANAAGSARILIDSNNPPAGALQFGNSFTLNNNITMQFFASNPSQRLGVATGLTAGIGGVISSAGGAAGIEKVGNGTMILTNNNTYTGTTVVTTGTLLVNGSNSSTALTTVAGGATLGGTGAIAGGVNVTGVLSPGASVESLSTGALTMNAGSTFLYEASDNSSTGADLLVANGGLSLTGVTLDLAGANLGLNSWELGDKLTLISYTGSAISSGFTGFDDDSVYIFGANQWLFDYNDTLPGDNFLGEANGSFFVTMTAVPEPSAALLGGLGMLALLRRRRIG